MKFLIVVLLVSVAAWAWWRYSQVPRPAFPPLQIPEDDPLMAAAQLEAVATLPQLHLLYSRPNKGARLKVTFVTSSGVSERLWAEIRRLDSDEAEVFYLTPPVTHTGQLERVHTHRLQDISDWVVEGVDGRYSGGFTMIVMFKRGREQWGALPAELEAEEKRYGPPANSPGAQL